MVSEIVLPAGASHVPVHAIPLLLARAIHPAPPEGAGNAISYPLKQSITPGATSTPRGEPLSEDDWAFLGTIWHDLPKFESGMSEATWGKYLNAFESSRHKPDWALMPCLSGGSQEAKMLQFIAEGDHKEAIRNAINKGELVALNRSRLPIHAGATGVQVDEAIVMIDALKTYAMRFGVNVRRDESPPVAGLQALPVVAAGVSGEDVEGWKIKACTQAKEIIRRQRNADLYPDQMAIADEIAKSFRVAGIVGADGKPLSGAYIKRHALKGISSADGKTLSTTPRQGK